MCIKEDKKVKEDAKKKDNGNNYNTGNKFGKDKQNKPDRSNLKCDECDRTGHTADTYWKTHPDLMPRALREKLENKAENKAKNNGKNKPEQIAALASTDVEKFKMTLAYADSGTDHSLSISDLTDPVSQKLKERCESWSEGLRGVDGMGESGSCVSSSFSSKAISAFVTGQFESSDIWLADSAANMYIVNDKKWFTKFHPFDLNINTADKTAALEIKGGGTVEIRVKTLDGDFIKWQLSEVAYTPKGRCNLLSVGILAEKASV